MSASVPSGFHVVIPARYASSRFPGKPLHEILGKPMVLHVVERARESSAQSIVVATDDRRIASVCSDAGVDVVMTRPDHPSGTDRIAEVAKLKEWSAEDRIVGLQGDEPAMPSEHIDRLAGREPTGKTQIALRLSETPMGWPCTSVELESLLVGVQKGMRLRRFQIMFTSILEFTRIEQAFCINTPTFRHRRWSSLNS